MPHQCLSCGSVFADGSPKILRGCPQCSGTRFFFTEKAISDSERDKLREQANKDIKNLVHEMLTGKVRPMDIQGDITDKDEWVNITFKSKSKAGGGDEEDLIQLEKKIVKSIDDLKFPEEKKSKKVKAAPKTKTEKVKEKPVKTKKAEKKKKVDSKKKENVKEERVAVIKISEDGVYDIDIEKLLEDSPIIVQKDGSYMVHLPSVFKKARKKKSVS
jgi:predicted  nucleic acid-binding Zn-ribbon protein